MFSVVLIVDYCYSSESKAVQIYLAIFVTRLNYYNALLLFKLPQVDLGEKQCFFIDQ